MKIPNEDVLLHSKIMQNKLSPKGFHFNTRGKSTSFRVHAYYKVYMRRVLILSLLHTEYSTRGKSVA